MCTPTPSLPPSPKVRRKIEPAHPRGDLRIVDGPGCRPSKLPPHLRRKFSRKMVRFSSPFLPPSSLPWRSFPQKRGRGRCPSSPRLHASGRPISKEGPIPLPTSTLCFSATQPLLPLLGQGGPPYFISPFFLGASTTPSARGNGNSIEQIVTIYPEITTWRPGAAASIPSRIRCCTPAAIIGSHCAEHPRKDF